VQSNAAYLLLASVAVLDLAILYRFFTVQVPLVKQAEEAARRAETLAKQDGGNLKTQEALPTP
jgi:hypothetical protein